MVVYDMRFFLTKRKMTGGVTNQLFQKNVPKICPAAPQEAERQGLFSGGARGAGAQSAPLLPLVLSAAPPCVLFDADFVARGALRFRVLR